VNNYVGGAFDRFFRDTGDLRQSSPSGRLWNPAADVYRTRDGWLVKLDLAGVKSDDIEITLDGALLRVSGCGATAFAAKASRIINLKSLTAVSKKSFSFPARLSARPSNAIIATAFCSCASTKMKNVAKR
jgi:HSP20 family molecular chaperone IbpA